jgi:hypothetical protein
MRHHERCLTPYLRLIFRETLGLKSDAGVLQAFIILSCFNAISVRVCFSRYYFVGSNILKLSWPSSV